MDNNRLEINRLKVRRECLFAELKRDFDRRYQGCMHFDVIVLANLYCEHQCGIESEFSARAAEIANIDQIIEEKEGKRFLQLWRASRSILKHLIESGRIKKEEQFEKAAQFLTIIENILSVDDVYQREEEQRKKQESQETEKIIWLRELMHPWIIEQSFEQYRNGHLRDAVLNAFIALGDLIRERTGIKLDGAKLANHALSEKDPFLILSEVETDSGRNDQVGFMQILQGAFTGIRNPAAHSVRHDLTEHKAVQYLVFASLLARRITEATIVKKDVI